MIPIFLALLQAAAPVAISVRPAPVLIERSAFAQRLEFDFILEGLTDDTVTVSAIRVVASDRAGRPWHIRGIDEAGADPSILTIPRRTIAGRGSLLVYNPFPVFAPDVPIARLEYASPSPPGPDRGRCQWR